MKLLLRYFGMPNCEARHTTKNLLCSHAEDTSYKPPFITKQPLAFLDNRLRVVVVIFLFLSLLIVEKGWGQVVTFDFAALIGSEATANSNFNNSNLNSSTISRGAGLTASANGDRFNATNWALTSIANAITGNDYMEFTLTPNSGFQFSVSSIVFQIQRSATGLTAVALRSSVDAYATNLDSEKAVTDNTSTQTFTFTFVQPNSSTTVTYRLYGYAEAGAGSGGPGDGTGNDIIVNGTVSATASCTPPTVSATGFNTTVSANSMNIAWTNPVSGADGVIVVARSVSGVNANPSSGTGYSPNSIYGSGSNLTNGNFVVYTGTGNSLSVTGLNSSTAYFFNIYTYTNTGTCYNTSGILTGTGVTTCSTPDNPSGVSGSTGNTQSIVTWTNGSCNDEMIIVAHTSSIGGTPTGTYTSNSRSFADVLNPNFPSGGKVVYNGSSSPQTITNLTNGTLYYFKLFTRKGSNWSSGVETTATPATVTSSSDYFRSRQTGDWSAISTWESSIDNSAWINATLVPSSTANNIVIQSGDIVTISGVTNLDQTTVLGRLVWNSSTNVITIADGSGDDLTIATGGVLEMAGTDISTIIFTGTLLVNRNGILRYTSGAGSGVSTILAGTSSNTKIVYLNGGIFDWNSISTYNSSSITYFATSNINDIPIFRNSQTPGSPVGAGTATVFNGIYEANSNIIFQNNGTKTFRNGIIGTGNVTQASGCGQFIISGSTATIGGTGILNIHTNGIVANSGTALTLSSSKTITGNALSNTFTVNGSIDCSTFVLSGSSTFALANNATLITANANGVTGSSASTGSIQMSSSSNELFDDEANYIFNGIGTQSTGFAGTSTQVDGTRNIVISNTTGIVTLDSDVQAPGLTGVLSVTSGSIFSLPNARNINKSGSGVVSIAGTIQAEDANGFSDGSSSNFQGFSNSDIILGANSVIEYNGGTQTVTNQVPYQNILFSSSSAKTPAGNISVFRNVSITGAGPLTLGNNIFTFGGDWYSTNQVNLSEGTSIVNWDGSGIQNLTVTGGENFYTLSISGSGTLNLNNAVSVGSGSNGGLAISSGTLDAGTNTLNSSAANMTMTGGLLRLAKTGTTLPEIGGTSYSNTAGTIELYGNGSQTLRGSRDYATLLFTANTVASVTSAPNSFTGIGIAGNAILDIQSFDVGGNFRTLTMTGSSLLRTSGSGAMPPMGDLYTLSPNTTIEIYGTNASTSIRQGPTTGGSNPHRYQNLIFSGVTTITAPANVLRVEGNIANNLTTGIFNNNSGTVSLTGTNQTIGGTSITNFHNLNVVPNAQVLLSSGQKLANALNIGAGAVFNANGNLTITSTLANTGRVEALLSGATVVGNVTMERFIPAKRSTRYFSSPVANANASQWKNNVLVTGPGGAANGFDAGSTLPTVIYYVETVLGILNSGWTAIPTINTPFETGRGYQASIRGDKLTSGLITFTNATTTSTTMALSGALNQGTISLPVTYANTGVISADGWNLIGNPYAAPIDWNSGAGWSKTGLDNAIYLFDPLTINTTPTTSPGSFFAYVNGVGSGPSPARTNPNVIASSQGFFVKANASTSLTINELAKTSVPHFSNFRTESQNYFHIGVISKSGLNDYTAIRFAENATLGFDSNLDAYKMQNSGVNISSKLENEIELSISSIPSSTDSLEIPLVVTVNTGTGYALHFTSFDTKNTNTQLFLKDKEIPTIVPVESEMKYSFDNTIGAKNRFSIVVKISKLVVVNTISGIATLTGIETLTGTNITIFDTQNNVTLYPNPLDGNILHVDYEGVASELEYSISDVFGKKYINIKLGITKGIVSINTENLANGLYLFSYLRNNERKSIKFIISR